MSSTAPRAAPTERTIRSIRWGFTARARRPASARCARRCASTSSCAPPGSTARTVTISSRRCCASPGTSGAAGRRRPDRLADQRGGHRRRDRADRAGVIADGNTAWGTYHFTGAGAVTWHGFRRGDFRSGIALARTAAASRVHYDRRLPDSGAAPSNSVLDCSRIECGVRHATAPVARGARRGDRGINDSRPRS